MRILLLEDHADLRAMIAAYLTPRGFAVDSVAQGSEALAALSAAHYDALILDLGLPDMDGLAVLDDARREAVDTPTLVLTARDAVEDRVRGLNAGADDYLTKPFDLTELEARLRALLRRPGRRGEQTLALGHVCLDVSTRTVTVRGRDIELARREVDCLEVLLRTPNRVVVKDALEERLYAHHEPVTPNALEAVISRLRRKLAAAEAAVWIETRRGIGYRVSDEVST